MVPAVWIREKMELMNASFSLPPAPFEAAASHHGIAKHHLLSYEPPLAGFEETLQDERSLSRSAHLASERAREGFHHSIHPRIDYPFFSKS